MSSDAYIQRLFDYLNKIELIQNRFNEYFIKESLATNKRDSDEFKKITDEILLFFNKENGANNLYSVRIRQALMYNRFPNNDGNYCWRCIDNVRKVVVAAIKEGSRRKVVVTAIKKASRRKVQRNKTGKSKVGSKIMAVKRKLRYLQLFMLILTLILSAFMNAIINILTVNLRLPQNVSIFILALLLALSISVVVALWLLENKINELAKNGIPPDSK